MLKESPVFPKSNPSKPRLRYLKWIALLLGLYILFDLASVLLAEGFWFQEVGYLQVFRTRLLLQGLLAIAGFGISLGVLWWNLAIAQQRAYDDVMDHLTYPMKMGLVRLLPLALLLSFTVGAMLIYHGRIAMDYWHPTLSLTDRVVQLPVKFHLTAIWQVAKEVINARWLTIGVLAQAIACLIYPQFWLRAIALLMSLSFGLVLSENWAKILLAIAPTAFGQTEPVFQQDIGFYIFQFPLISITSFWLMGVSALALISVLLIYVLSGDSLSQGRFSGFSPPQRQHLMALTGIWMLAIAFSYWLERYELLYSPQGVTYGASYTNVTVQLPVYTFLSVLALVLAIVLFSSAIVVDPTGSVARTAWYRVACKDFFPTARLLLVSLLAYWLIAAIASLGLPIVVQRMIVQPNELDLERPYLSHTITLTRDAFALEKIDVEPFNPQGELTTAVLKENDLTIQNIRLWDTRPLLETNRQLQQFRLYYRFPDADVDRYTLKNPDGTRDRQQVLIAARELDFTAVPAEAQTWINEHLVYTHGYGFTLSPVDQVAAGGLPDYLIKDIDHIASSPSVADSIPVDAPRIYYGEISDTYVMVKTKQQELDFPSGSENSYNTYDGSGGVNIGSLWQRMIFAKYLHDWRMLLTENFTPETQLLFRRNINQRVRAIAPFLRYDTDPYLVVADTGDESNNHLYWVVDAYTTSDRYPYSDPFNNSFNYIRNSSKIVIDAYNGTVQFYIADETDPIIQSWNRIFPEMFRPLTEMPASLQAHLRYPQDFFRVQSQQLMTYHMTDTQVFYNREDQWRAPTEIYGEELQPVEPYYLIMKLPAETSEEFILLRLFTPAQRNNLIAWLAARSDGVAAETEEENQYGRMLLYRFPKQELIYGTEQIEARINQDPAISEQISLWNRQGSRAIQGNLLVIPIEQSLLYVEPLYLEAEQNRLPTLARVIVVYENRIVMAERLDQALEGIFQPEPRQPAIIRSVEEEIAPLLETPPTDSDNDPQDNDNSAPTDNPLFSPDEPASEPQP